MIVELTREFREKWEISEWLKWLKIDPKSIYSHPLNYPKYPSLNWVFLWSQIDLKMMRTNLGSDCTLRWNWHIFFVISRSRQWSSCRTHIARNFFAFLVLATRHVAGSRSWLHAGCFGNLIAKVWVLLNDPMGGPWESWLDVWTLYTIFYLFKVFFTSF